MLKGFKIKIVSFISYCILIIISLNRYPPNPNQIELCYYFRNQTTFWLRPCITRDDIVDAAISGSEVEYHVMTGKFLSMHFRCTCSCCLALSFAQIFLNEKRAITPVTPDTINEKGTLCKADSFLHMHTVPCQRAHFHVIRKMSVGLVH